MKAVYDSPSHHIAGFIVSSLKSIPSQHPFLKCSRRPPSSPSRRAIFLCRSSSPGPSFVVISDEDDDHVAIHTVQSASELGPDPQFIEECDTCSNTGFIPCPKCDAKGYIKNPRSVNVFYCPDCVGHRKLRCPTCGGKCYMCE